VENQTIARKAMVFCLTRRASVDLKQTLERERNLTLSTPSFLGAVRVVPVGEIVARGAHSG